MRRSLALAVLPLLLVAACGGGGSSSSVSEEDAAALLELETTAIGVKCVRSEDADRNFDCNAFNEESEVKVGITVAESGESLVVTHCEEPGQKAIEGWRNPCEGVG
jgi:hypothetical protein